MLPLTQYLDRDYEIDILEFRRDFARVNVSKPQELLDWFMAHPYLSASDVARIANAALPTVYRWRALASRAAGVGPQRRFALPPLPGRPPLPTPPPNWQDSDWLETAYGTYGIQRLAWATGRRPETIYRRLKKRIKLRSVQEATASAHPCSQRAWLLKHYVADGLSVVRCAKLAGVARLTMTNWLTKQRIRIRSNSEQVRMNHVAKKIGLSTS